MRAVSSAGTADRSDAKADAVRRVLIEDRQDLLRFIGRKIPDSAEAEEVLQRFALRALEKSTDLRAIESVRGWLSRVLASTIADHNRSVGRKRRRETVLDADDPGLAAPPPGEEFDGAICACLYKLLPTLRPSHAEAIWRADLIGDSRERVARSLGISATNLNVRLFRARQALKARLQEMCLTCPVGGFFDCRCDAPRRDASARKPTTASRVTDRHSRRLYPADAAAGGARGPK